MEIVSDQYAVFRARLPTLEQARLHLANNEASAAHYLLERLSNNILESDSSSKREMYEHNTSQAQALIIAAEMSQQTHKADEKFVKVNFLKSY